MINFSKTLLLSDVYSKEGFDTEQEATLDVHVMFNVDKFLTLFNNFLETKTHNTRSLLVDIGVDEAGRGPLLGSVLVGAVILPPEISGDFLALDLKNTEINQLNDSKKISEKKRNDLYQKLDSVALAYAYVDVSASIIDEINILQASLVGMKVATQAIMEHLSTLLSHEQLTHLSIQALFDGNKVPNLDYTKMQTLGLAFNDTQAIAVVKGDAKITSIAMASVLAKVTRDKQMYELAQKYPQYGIESHKGYPTKQHFASLEKYGALPEHRTSFAPVAKVLQQ